VKSSREFVAWGLVVSEHKVYRSFQRDHCNHRVFKTRDLWKEKVGRASLRHITYRGRSPKPVSQTMVSWHWHLWLLYYSHYRLIHSIEVVLWLWYTYRNIFLNSFSRLIEALWRLA
jgi:hypothetical protein